eukprot:Gb_14823 [translate_table: standard]
MWLRRRPVVCCGGNLKLLDATNNSVWESFNNPTDTLIPAQILQVGMRLVSSKSATDFSEGTYSLVAKNCGVVLYYNLTTSSAALPYWVWALGNDTAAVDSSKCGFNELVMGSASFSLRSAIARMAPTIIGSSYENTASPEISFQNSGVDPTPYTYLRLDSDGVLRGSSFSSGWSYVFQLDQYLEDPCFMPNSCNSYGVCTSLQGQSGQCSCPDSNSFVPNSTTTPNAGCTRRVPLESDCTGKEDMMMLSGIDYFPNQYMKALNLSEEAACRDECLRNCSCLAAFYWNNSGSCFHIADGVRSLKNTGDRTRTAYLKIQLDRHSSSKISYKGLAKVEEEFKDYRQRGLFKRFSLKELQRATEGFGQKIGWVGDGVIGARERYEERGDYDEEELEIMLNLAFKCIQRESSSRPPMGEVVQILERRMEGGVLMNPVFAFDREENEVIKCERNEFSGPALSSVVAEGR